MFRMGGRGNMGVDEEELRMREELRRREQHMREQFMR
jgi:hypothetical protein